MVRYAFFRRAGLLLRISPGMCMICLSRLVFFLDILSSGPGNNRAVKINFHLNYIACAV